MMATPKTQMESKYIYINLFNSQCMSYWNVMFEWNILF